MEKHDNTTEHKHETTTTGQLQANKSWRWFLYIIGAGLVVTALIAVLSILIGGADGFIDKAIWTTILVMLHALVALGLLHATPSDKKPQFMVGVAFAVTLGSLVVSTLGVWDILEGWLVGRLYFFFILTLIAGGVAQLVLLSAQEDKKTRAMTYVTVGLDAMLLLVLLPWVIVEESSNLPEIYYRIIAALSILLGTSAILTAITHLLYRANNPKQKKPGESISAGMIVFWVLLGILLVYGGPFLLPVLFL